MAFTRDKSCTIFCTTFAHAIYFAHEQTLSTSGPIIVSLKLGSLTLRVEATAIVTPTDYSYQQTGDSNEVNAIPSFSNSLNTYAVMCILIFALSILCTIQAKLNMWEAL